LVEDENEHPKALRQLAKLASAVRQGLIPTAAGASAKGRNAIIYPVVVVVEAAMEAFGVNRFLNGIFQHYVAGIEGEIRPLTIMSIQELEEVLAHTASGVFTWRELLDSRFDHEQVCLWSIHQAIHDLIAVKGARSVPNEFRKAQFDRIAVQIFAKYRSSDVPGAGRRNGESTDSPL
jgi:hypothetical protein